MSKGTELSVPFFIIFNCDRTYHKMDRWYICFMKKFLMMLLILFICGVISADLCIEELGNSNVLFNIEIFEGYANADLVFKDVFWNIFYERAKLMFILVMLCFTPIKEKISIILISVFSFTWGFFFMSCITELGMTGIMVGLAAVLPHGLLYGGIVIMLLLRKNRYSYHQRDSVKIGVVTYLAIIIMFITGCVLESIMGTQFIPWAIRLGLI